jgi:hypothetical protein
MIDYAKEYIILYSDSARYRAKTPPKPIAIYEVERRTKTLVIGKRILGVRGSLNLRDKIGAHRIATKSELVEARKAIEAEAAEWRSRQEAMERRAADPKYQRASWFASVSTESWEKLTLDQLDQIAEWLESKGKNA